MPDQQPISINERADDWEGLQRTLNYLIKDIYSILDEIQGRAGNTFEPESIILPEGTGILTGPSTDNAIARFDGVDGAIQNSVPIVTDAGSILLPNGTIDLSAIGFAANPDCGLYYTPGGGGTIYGVINGVRNFELTAGEVNSHVWLRIIKGAVDALSVTFGNDVNTGFYSPGDDELGLVTHGVLRVHVTDAATIIGGAANYLEVKADGEINLHGTAKVTKSIPLPIVTGGGTSTVSGITGSSSIDFNADGETAYAKFHVPEDWDAASDIILKAMVQNQIAETDNDDVSFTGTVHGIADGELNADAGQAVAMALNLTGGDEAINIVNLVSGTIVYDDGAFPIAVGDSVIIKIAVNLGGGGECTGPLHILDWWLEYASDKLGEAT